MERAWLERKIEALRRVYEGHGRVFRALWVVAAVMVLLTGLVLMVLPGPAVVVIPFGLAMLAAASGWGHRLVRLGLAGTHGRRHHSAAKAGLALGVLSLTLAAAAAVAAFVIILNW